MQFLANENFPLDAVEALRDSGHEVAWVRIDSPGSKDPEVLARAVREQRILLTFDKDFGELAFHSGLPSGCGIVLFRIRMTSSTSAAKLVVKAIGSRSDWAGHFAVVENGRIRMKELPPSS